MLSKAVSVFSTPNFLVVHSMGKVGSTSLYEGLKKKYLEEYNSSARVLQTHRLNSATIEKFKAEHEKLPPHIRDAVRFLDKDHTGTLLICPVRDPLSRNVSAFFNNIHNYIPGKDLGGVTTEQLVTLFLKKYAHDLPARWFDEQVKSVFGIDVYAESLDFQTGGHVIRGDDISILLQRVEDPEELRLQAVRSFTGFSDLELPRLNVGSDKAYKDAYDSFRKTFRPPADLVDRVYQSRFSTHFYTAAEIAGFKDRWFG